jgi:hypothetical protein
MNENLRLNRQGTAVDPREYFGVRIPYYERLGLETEQAFQKPKYNDIQELEERLSEQLGNFLLREKVLERKMDVIATQLVLVVILISFVLGVVINEFWF